LHAFHALQTVIVKQSYDQFFTRLLDASVITAGNIFGYLSNLFQIPLFNLFSAIIFFMQFAMHP